jgi:hypothetical protein
MDGAALFSFYFYPAMKKRILAILFLTATLSSCQDFLNLKPAYQISDQSFYQNQNDFETALVGVYSTSRELYRGSAIHLYGELSTDNAEIQWSSPSADEMQMDQNGVTATNAFVRGVWNTCLYTISQSDQHFESDRCGQLRSDGQKSDQR